MNNLIGSFILTTLAGLSTLLGLAILLLKNKNKDKITASSLSFAAGVMLCVSITDLIPESVKLLTSTYNGFLTILSCFISIIIGIIISLIIEKTIKENNTVKDISLYKIGIISMITIIIHNIPEGIITFLTSSINSQIGLRLAIAIALHNIPEGISIGIPIYYSTKNKQKAFNYTLIAALSEPLGAILAYTILYKYLNNTLLGIILGIISGIMINISLFEFIPKAKEYNNNKLINYWFIIGIMIMLLNIIFIN